MASEIKTYQYLRDLLPVVEDHLLGKWRDYENYQENTSLISHDLIDAINTLFENAITNKIPNAIIKKNTENEISLVHPHRSGVLIIQKSTVQNTSVKLLDTYQGPILNRGIKLTEVTSADPIIELLTGLDSRKVINSYSRSTLSIPEWNVLQKASFLPFVLDKLSRINEY